MSSPPFTPARWLSHPDAQTLFGYLARPRSVPALRRERWETPDGDFIDLDRVEGVGATPHVLVLHGLEGSSRSGYVRALLRGAQARGWGASAMNFRSCSGVPNRQLRSYSSGDTGDPRWVLRELRRRGVGGPLVAVGFSLGGNVLLKLLAEEGEETPLSAAVSISTPFNLLRCAQALDASTGLGAVYRRHFLRTLKHKALEKVARFPGRLEERAIRAARGIIAFDDAVTARVHGFRDALDYYARCSSGPLLERICRPTLLISSADDPLVPDPAPPAGAGRNSLITLDWLTRGGHVGFVAGSAWRPEFWAEVRALDFLELRVKGATLREAQISQFPAP